MATQVRETLTEVEAEAAVEEAEVAVDTTTVVTAMMIVVAAEDTVVVVEAEAEADTMIAVLPTMMVETAMPPLPKTAAGVTSIKAVVVATEEEEEAIVAPTKVEVATKAVEAAVAGAVEMNVDFMVT